jgi:sugar phosphate isomerase/epimerase
MQKLALSTSFTSNRQHTAKTLLDSLEKLNVAELELDYRIGETLYKQLRKALKQSHLKVVSVHNFFPIPSIRPDSGGGGDLFLLSHPDKEQRNQAIAWSAKSIEHARTLGARAVVLHCGCVDMNPELEKFSDRLVGIHLHDATGLSDHLVPGTGKIAFDGLKSYIHPNTLPVMELKPGTPDEQVLQGIQFLDRLGFN